MKAINPNIFPKGGYLFKDPDGTVHTGDSWAGVRARVKAYRKRQGKPVDTVDEEVITQACQRNPVLCVEEHPANAEQMKKVSLKGRVLLWLNRVRNVRGKRPLVFVAGDLNAARADVCFRCSKNQGTPEGCGSCRAALKALRDDIIGSRNFDQRLNACGVLGEYLPVSTWLELQAVPDPELPWECWRKRSL